ncbi:MAG: DUF3267 domain-containing protein [Planctomycetota bacterium]|jgi:hypothetical protein
MQNVENLDKIGEVRLGKIVANLYGIGALVILLIMLAFLAGLMPHKSVSYESGLWAWIFLVMLISGLFLHELLHAYAMLKWGKVDRKDIKFGFFWIGMIPYAHCKAPISVKAYRIVSLLPLYVLGGISLCVLAVFPNIFTVGAAAIIISASVGDIIIFLKLRRFDSSSFVRDHPTEIGCDIFEQPAP